jgi:hypothetical protein
LTKLSLYPVRTYVDKGLPLFSLLLALAVAGCGPDASAKSLRAAIVKHRPAAAAAKGVAFRFAGERGGDTRLYVLPRLDEATWRFRTPGLAVQRVIGFSRGEEQIYLLNAKGDLVGLDLGAGRVHTVDSSIAAAVLGPTGVLHLVRMNGTIGAIEYRSVIPWPDTLREQPQAVWGGGSERLIALVAGATGRELVTMSASKPPVRQPIPDGPLALSGWGDLAAVAVDSGLVTLNPADTTRRAFRRLSARPEAVTFSPSGHRLYVADAEQYLVVLDRYTWEMAKRERLPGRASALRADPTGRVVLARPAAGDSVWLIDAASARTIGTLPGSWRDDLPMIAPDGSILVVRGQDIVAHAADSLNVHGRVANGARDRWLGAAWNPRRPQLQLASDTAAAPTAGGPGELFYVQVSSTSNETWAQAMARDLRGAGLQAGVLPPTSDDDRYRVVLGPYPTHESADAIGKKLGRPFWIFTREGQDQPR